MDFFLKRNNKAYKQKGSPLSVPIFLFRFTAQKGFLLQSGLVFKLHLVFKNGFKVTSMLFLLAIHYLNHLF